MININLNFLDKELDLKSIENLLVEGEHLADTVKINIPREYSGADLSNKTFVLKIINHLGAYYETVLPHIVQNDYIALDWDITREFTSVAGTLTVNIIAQDETGYLLASKEGIVNVQPTVNSSRIPIAPETVLEDYLREMRTLSADVANDAIITESAKLDAVTAKTASESAKDGAELALTETQAIKTSVEYTSNNTISVTNGNVAESETLKNLTATASDVAISAKNEAEAARDAAALSQSDALASKNAAAASQSAAETAKTGAEEARDIAETAADEAEAARDAAVTAADNVAQDLAEHKLDYTQQVGTVANLTTTSKEVVGAINEVNANKANKVQEDWITPTLLNGWVENVYNPVGFMKDELGFVHIKGRISSGAIGTIVFYLPVGYRPVNQFAGFTALTNSSAGSGFIYSVNGGVHILSGSTANYYLDSILFKAKEV